MDSVVIAGSNFQIHNPLLPVTRGLKLLIILINLFIFSRNSYYEEDAPILYRSYMGTFFSILKGMLEEMFHRYYTYGVILRISKSITQRCFIRRKKVKDRITWHCSSSA